MAVRSGMSSQFDFDFEPEPYSYGAEQALTEQERSFEELEAAVKETPPRTPHGHGRNSSEPRALGDVIDESERLLPPGSPGLRHPKGRLESSTRSSPIVEHFADNAEHEPINPYYRPISGSIKRKPPRLSDEFPRVVKDGVQAMSPSPSLPSSTKAKPAMARLSSVQANGVSDPSTMSTTATDSYAEVVKHETDHEKDTTTPRNVAEQKFVNHERTPTKNNKPEHAEKQDLMTSHVAKQPSEQEVQYPIEKESQDPVREKRRDEVNDASQHNSTKANQDDIKTEHQDVIKREAADGMKKESDDGIKEERDHGIKKEGDAGMKKESDDGIKKESDDDIKKESDDDIKKESDDDIKTENNKNIEEVSSTHKPVELQVDQKENKQHERHEEALTNGHDTAQSSLQNNTQSSTHKPQHDSASTVTNNSTEYAEVVKREPTSPSLPPPDLTETTNKSNHNKFKQEEEDFADSATTVAEDDTPPSLEGSGKDSSARSPHRRAHKKVSSRSLDRSAHSALQQALQETATLPGDTSKDTLTVGQGNDKTKEEQDGQAEEPGALVYENYHSRSGTNLASVKLDSEFDIGREAAEEEQDLHDDASETTAVSRARESKLTSGRTAGAGWARSAIRWAPLNVPLQRRLQTLAVLMHSLSIGGLLALFFALCTIPVFWPILLPYLIYVLLSRAPSDGTLKLRKEWIRRSKFWSLFASYFPARLHRTVELEPTRKYIFGYHPHGIISHGAFAAFTTEALGFGQLFPGITNTLLTLDSNFRIPLYRDWALRLGLASVSRESCENLLSKGGLNGKGMGRAITIVIGGARESLDAKPGTLNLVLARRKGFVKLAVRTGADLVPVLAFGENDMYDQLSSETHPWIHKVQMMVKKFMGFTVPLFHARGIFNYDVGIMPYRRPVNIVVGRPIKTVQSKQPNPEYVDDLHKQYTDELLHIWEEWKDVFAPQRNCELAIIE